MVSKSALQTIDRVIRQGSIAFDTSIHHRCLLPSHANLFNGTGAHGFVSA